MDVTITVGSRKLQLTPKLPAEAYVSIKKHFTYKIHNYQFTTQHKMYGWDGSKTTFFKNQTGYSGSLFRLKKILEDEFKYNVTVEYENDYPPVGTPDIHGLVLQDFQQRAVSQALKFRRGIIEAPVRAGKTAIAAAILKAVGHFPAIVVTYGKDLVNQTRESIAFHLQREVGIFSESVYEPSDIIVTSYQALGRLMSSVKNAQSGVKVSEYTGSRNLKIIDLVREARVLILDECHHALAPKNSKILQEFTAAGYTIGLSGTPKPDNAHILEIESAIGGIIFKVKYETLIKHGRLAKPNIVMYKLPYKWYATGLSNFQDIYEENIVMNIYRNNFIAQVANKLIEKGKTVFIMVRKLAHGPILRGLIPGSTFVHGTIESKYRSELYEALQKKQISCIISTVGKEGLNLPKLDAVINAEGLESSVTTMQKMRSLTASEGKKQGLVIDFIDNGKFLKKHSHGRLKVYNKLGKDATITTKLVPADHYEMENSRWNQSH